MRFLWLVLGSLTVCVESAKRAGEQEYEVAFWSSPTTEEHQGCTGAPNLEVATGVCLPHGDMRSQRYTVEDPPTSSPSASNKVLWLMVYNDHACTDYNSTMPISVNVTFGECESFWLFPGLVSFTVTPQGESLESIKSKSIIVKDSKLEPRVNDAKLAPLGTHSLGVSAVGKKESQTETEMNSPRALVSLPPSSLQKASRKRTGRREGTASPSHTGGTRLVRSF
uniref:Uncharacterized protein n=1 Tax=Chromera velia CCMP2878 TaxID=1169474 RepID=A0A0G4HNG7_9ALVE|eukprot:Cvel_29418.t1-p1 / transcript=Cvel_29418.t1 / gene=Cvel_29418 / organism=Chromera_velia_CCMP2878 / gene_product=hypothetical protein / transcript_product=hypothetical protein / location=Cvel_scaffold4016:4969-6892(+) / protein_length=223 / sequence_SO=supercontig / SO=protein_coding / is_pseudo=false